MKFSVIVNNFSQQEGLNSSKNFFPEKIASFLAIIGEAAQQLNYKELPAQTKIKNWMH